MDETTEAQELAHAEIDDELVQESKNGEAEAQYSIGYPYRTSEQKQWLTKAAEQGYIPAIHRISYLYLHGVHGCEQDMAKAVKWLSAITDDIADNNRGDLCNAVSACVQLACLLLCGDGCQQDENAANIWLQRARKFYFMEWT